MITRRFINYAIGKGYQPYIKGHTLSYKGGGVIISFKDHADWEYNCSIETGKEIIESVASLTK